MKTIKGKKYYISLGYVDEEKVNGTINAKDIKSIFMQNKSKDKTALYVDDSDKDNIISLPLLQVNDIQRDNDILKFMVIVSPYKMNFDENENYKKINVVGLFEEYKKDNIEYIKHIAFYQFDSTRHVTKGEASFTILVEAESSKVIGG